MGCNVLNIRKQVISCGVALARKGARQTIAAAVKLAEHVSLDVLAEIVRIARYAPAVK